MEDGRRQELLIVEDDRDLCQLLEIQLSCERCNIRLAYTVFEALKLMERLEPGTHSINIIDYYLDHDHTGVQLAIEFNARGYNCTNILMTGKDNEEVKQYIRDFELQMKFGKEVSLFADILEKSKISGDRIRDVVRKHMSVQMQNYL